MIVASIDCFAAFVALGLVVVFMRRSHYDVHGARLRGFAIPLAVLFTESGRWKPLAVLAALAFAVFAVARWPLWIPVAILVSQITSQAVVEGVKRLYHRVRPEDWLVRIERGYSYPSGHAATAVTFYGAWAVVAVLSPLPPALRISFAALLLVWAIGIAWSRLALAAHFVTDDIGGWLFGTGWVCLAVALIYHTS